jgi:hypothetical protein
VLLADLRVWEAALEIRHALHRIVQPGCGAAYPDAPEPCMAEVKGRQRGRDARVTVKRGDEAEWAYGAA